MRDTTTRVQLDGERPRFFRRRFSLAVLEGPDKGRGLTSAKDQVTVGSAPQNELVLNDTAVSRHHLRVESTPAGFLLADLDSTNGTTLGNVTLKQVVARGPVDLRLGETLLRFTPLTEEEEVPILAEDHFGGLLGRSPSMRELFRRMELAAPQEVTVLLEGETGTGKELLAWELHQHSRRSSGPFVVVDCGAIPPTLIESELFGHLRGAFTNAQADRPGAFEQAHTGTVFLDEIGELDLAMQPRLLRMLERGQVKRLGENVHREVNVRIVAATNRDLQRAVNQGTFRADLFYRLAVMHLRVPPLRDRPEDVELLVERLLPEIAERFGLAAPPALSRETLQQLVRHPWPGNVRELRNFLERLVTLSASQTGIDPFEDLQVSAPHHPMGLDQLDALPFKDAKAIWLEHFDMHYLARLLERCDHNVAEASRQSGIDRVHLFRLIKKYKLKR